MSRRIVVEIVDARVHESDQELLVFVDKEAPGMGLILPLSFFRDRTYAELAAQRIAEWFEGRLRVDGV